MNEAMNELQLLSGQHVLVLGGSGAVGRAIAGLAFRHGAKVTSHSSEYYAIGGADWIRSCFIG